MPPQSYKILAAQRLAIDPNELLMYYEHMGIVFATTPDGHQHKFTYAELDRPRARPSFIPPSKPFVKPKGKK